MIRTVAPALVFLLLLGSSLHAQVCYLEEQRGPAGNPAQQWRLKDVGSGLFVIENIRLTNERHVPMVLDYRGGSQVYLEQQRGPQGNRSQQWRLRGIGNSTFLIENVRLSEERTIPMVLDYRQNDEAYLEEQRGPTGNPAQQ
jgi:hypothetical protein